MINEEGTIKKIIGDKAVVHARRGSMCESCGQKKACGSLANTDDVEIEAINTANAKIGDRVYVSIRPASLLKITTLVYLIPVISLIIGIIIGNKIGLAYSFDPELSSFVAGIILFIITFLFIKIIANRISNQTQYMPEITKILVKTPDCENGQET